MNLRKKTIFAYKRHESLKDYICFYCGQYGESKDHCPPVSYVEVLPDYKKIMVRCCLVCNLLLGARPYFTLLSRCEYLLQRYPSRFKRALAIPNWSQDDIDELTGALKRSLINGLKKKKFIEIKIISLKEKIDSLREEML